MYLAILRTLVFWFFAQFTVAFAQEPPVKPSVAAPKEMSLSGHTKFVNGVTQKILLRTAETMPEEHYGFKPVDSVRTFGQIVGHVADTQYFFCATALGQKSPSPGVEKNKTSKTELIASLREAFAYCGKVYDSVDDTTGRKMVKFSNHDMPALGVLNVNMVHTMEHYGNLVTYMRMKNLVPPTSDQEFMKNVAN